MEGGADCSCICGAEERVKRPPPHTFFGGNRLIDPRASRQDPLWRYWLTGLNVLQSDETLADVARCYPDAEEQAQVAVQVQAGRCWVEAGRVVYRFAEGDAGELRAVALAHLHGKSALSAIPGLQIARERGDSWGCYVQIDRAPGGTIPRFLGLRGAGIALDIEGKMMCVLDVYPIPPRSHLARVCGILAPGAEPGDVQFVGGVQALLRAQSPADAAGSRDTLIWNLRLALSLAWAAESPWVAVRVPARPLACRGTRRRVAALASRTASERVVTLLSSAQRAELRRVAEIPAPRSTPPTAPDAAGDPRWAPDHTAVRWVAERNLRDDDEPIDIRERGGRWYFACPRPIQGWGEIPPDRVAARRHRLISRWAQEELTP